MLTRDNFFGQDALFQPGNLFSQTITVKSDSAMLLALSAKAFRSPEFLAARKRLGRYNPKAVQHNNVTTDAVGNLIELQQNNKTARSKTESGSLSEEAISTLSVSPLIDVAGISVVMDRVSEVFGAGQRQV